MMVAIEIAGPVGVFLALVGSVFIYLDGRNRGMETADMWAVGFFVGMFLPPIIGAVVVGVVYLERRSPRRPRSVGELS